jgi:hypothetical protein
MATNGIRVALANGDTRRLATPEGADPEQLMEAFVSDATPFGGEWLETDDGEYLRKSAIVRAFVESDDANAKPGMRAPGFPKTDRPYNA